MRRTQSAQRTRRLGFRSDAARVFFDFLAATRRRSKSILIRNSPRRCGAARGFFSRRESILNNTFSPAGNVVRTYVCHPPGSKRFPYNPPGGAYAYLLL